MGEYLTFENEKGRVSILVTLVRHFAAFVSSAVLPSSDTTSSCTALLDVRVLKFFSKTYRLNLLSLQCHNGHTLCSTCKAKVEDRCPSCRCQLGSIRCLVLEKVQQSFSLH
jgi:hypothetical protein